MKTFVIRTVLVGASLACLASGAMARDPVHAGSFTLQISKQEVQPLGSKDHVLISQVSRGTNKSTGSEPVGDGGQALSSETVELDHGNGPDHGLYTVADDKGSTTAEYRGKVTTTMVDGKPRTSAQGTWRYVSSSGAYKGADGTGTYTWTMTSPTEAIGEWKENMATAKR